MGVEVSYMACNHGEDAVVVVAVEGMSVCC